MARTPKPLLYRPPPRWQWWAAFGGAVAIHLTAVAVAQKREVPAEIPPDIPTAVVEATLQASEEPTPPPEDIPLPEPPPPPEITPEYVEETTPPPKQPKPQRMAPIKAPQVAGRPGASPRHLRAASPVSIRGAFPPYHGQWSLRCRG